MKGRFANFLHGMGAAFEAMPSEERPSRLFRPRITRLKDEDALRSDWLRLAYHLNRAVRSEAHRLPPDERARVLSATTDVAEPDCCILLSGNVVCHVQTKSYQQSVWHGYHSEPESESERHFTGGWAPEHSDDSGEWQRIDIDGHAVVDVSFVGPLASGELRGRTGGAREFFHAGAD